MLSAPRTRKRDLVYYIHDGSTTFRFQLSGDLSGDGVQDLEQTWRTASSIFGGRSLVLDLTLLAGMDRAGRELLERWQREGASITVASPRAKERIELMMDGPVTLLGTNSKGCQWHPFRAVQRWAAALLAIFFPAAAAP